MILANTIAAISLGIAAPVITPKAGFNGQSSCYAPFSRVHQIWFNEQIAGPNFNFADCRVIENPGEPSRTRIIFDWRPCDQGTSFEATDSCGTYLVEMRGNYRKEGVPGKPDTWTEKGPVFKDEVTWWQD